MIRHTFGNGLGGFVAAARPDPDIRGFKLGPVSPIKHPRIQVGPGRGAAAGCSSTRSGPPARFHPTRAIQVAGVIAVADDLAFASERAVDRERQPDGQPVHAAAGAAGLVAFDDEVAVVLLDREVNHPEPVDRGPRDGAPERSEHARRTERRQSGRGADGDLHRVSGIDLGAGVVRH